VRRRSVVLVDHAAAKVSAFAPTLVGGEVDGQQHDVLIAGDDEGTNQKVSQLGRLIEETCAPT